MAKLSGIDDVVTALTQGGQPQVSVRRLLEWFGAQRRGWRVIDAIGRELEKHGLATEPEYANAHIDELLTFRQVAKAGSRPAKAGQSVPAPGAANAVSGGGTAHAHRVRSVPSARHAVESVSPDTPVQKALSLLLGRGISQLAVVSGKHQLRGVFSWASYGAALTLGQAPKLVQDAMDAPRMVLPEADLFEVSRDVATKGPVIVIDAHNKIVGIVTASDISRYLADLAEPFALVGEVEGHLRTLRRRAAGLQNGGEEETLSEQHAWFGKEWNELGLTIDREFFLKELDEVRAIRNDIAHFSIDPLDEARLARLRDFARLLARVVGA